MDASKWRCRPSQHGSKREREKGRERVEEEEAALREEEETQQGRELEEKETPAAQKEPQRFCESMTCKTLTMILSAVILRANSFCNS